MKAKRRLLSREELLDLEDKYFPGTLGNLLSLGRRTSGNRTARTVAALPATALLTAAKLWLPDFPKS